MGVPVVFLRSIRITEMTKVVVPPQMLKQFVVIQKPAVAEFTQRMSAVRRVVRVALYPMSSQFFTVVPLPLIGENLRVKFVRLYVTHLTISLVL